jgi:hypothetical protein
MVHAFLTPARKGYYKKKQSGNDFSTHIFSARLARYGNHLVSGIWV